MLNNVAIAFILKLNKLSKHKPVYHAHVYKLGQKSRTLIYRLLELTSSYPYSYQISHISMP